MSTKIYTGFKYRKNTIDEPFRIAKVIKGLLNDRKLPFNYKNDDIAIAELGFAFLGHDSYGVILDKYNCHNYNIYECLVEQQEVIDFCYWNNTDPLDGVTDEEWIERGELWDKVFLNYTPMCQSMFFIDIHSEGDK